METAAQSGETSIAEDLMTFFVEQNERECFAALLYTCYDLIKPDQALEVAWTHGLIDFVMPFMIQYLKDYTSKVRLALSYLTHFCRMRVNQKLSDINGPCCSIEVSVHQVSCLLPAAAERPCSVKVAETSYFI